MESIYSFLGKFAFLDILGVLLALGFILLGVWRGLGWQLTRFLGVILAMGVARILAPMISGWVSPIVEREDSQISLGISYVLIFLFILASFTVVSQLVVPWFEDKKGQKLKETFGLKDSKHRILAGTFGLFTAAGIYTVLVVSLLLFGSMKQVRRAVDASKGATATAWVVSKLGIGFPGEASWRAKKIMTWMEASYSND